MPNFCLSLKSLSLYFPIPPTGFRVTHHRYPALLLTTAEIYLWLFTFQSALATHHARELSIHILFFGLPIFSATIQVIAADPLLTYGEVIWGLYETGAEISRSGGHGMPDRMPAIGTSMYMSTLGLVGFISIKPNPVPGTWGGLLPAGNMSQEKTPSTASEKRSRKAASRVRAWAAGDARSTEDPDLVLHYHFDGRKLAPRQMMTAFLRTMTFCSEHHDDELGAEMVAFSADGFVRLRLEGVQAGGPGPYLLSWGMARLALRTLWAQVVMGFHGRYPVNPRWEAFSFFLEYRGVMIGEGYIG